MDLVFWGKGYFGFLWKTVDFSFCLLLFFVTRQTYFSSDLITQFCHGKEIPPPPRKLEWREPAKQTSKQTIITTKKQKQNTSLCLSSHTALYFFSGFVLHFWFQTENLISISADQNTNEKKVWTLTGGEGMVGSTSFESYLLWLFHSLVFFSVNRIPHFIH